MSPELALARNEAGRVAVIGAGTPDEREFTSHEALRAYVRRCVVARPRCARRRCRPGTRADPPERRIPCSAPPSGLRFRRSSLRKRARPECRPTCRVGSFRTRHADASVGVAPGRHRPSGTSSLMLSALPVQRPRGLPGSRMQVQSAGRGFPAAHRRWRDLDQLRELGHRTSALLAQVGDHLARGYKSGGGGGEIPRRGAPAGGGRRRRRSIRERLLDLLRWRRRVGRRRGAERPAGRDAGLESAAFVDHSGNFACHMKSIKVSDFITTVSHVSGRIARLQGGS